MGTVKSTVRNYVSHKLKNKELRECSY